MADRLTFPEADTDYKPFYAYDPGVYGHNFDLVGDFSWVAGDDQEPNYVDPFIPFCGSLDDGEANLGLVNGKFSAQDPKYFPSRPRTSTVGSQQSSDGAEIAKFKQKQRRQVAKVQGQFRCRFEDCARHARPFGSSSDLRRHLHEIHNEDPQGAFPLGQPCPWPQCARSEKIFKRHKNLKEHLEKKHGGKNPDATTNMGTSAPTLGASTISTLQDPDKPGPSMPSLPMSPSSPPVRIRRMDRRKARDAMKRRIATLRQNESMLASQIEDISEEIDQMQSALNHLQDLQRTNDQYIQSMEEQMDVEDVQDGVQNASAGSDV